MGVPKTRLEWCGTHLLSYQITSLAAAGADPIVTVVPPSESDLVMEAAALLGPHGPELTAVSNPHPERGKTESIRLGVSELGSCDAILIAAVDQPRSSALLEALIGAHFQLGRGITVPVHRNRRGHPVVFAAKLRHELLEASERTLGMRGVVQADGERLAEWETEDPSVGLEFNTPEEYERARS